MNVEYEKASGNQTWRDVLPVHPAAELLSLLDREKQLDLGRQIKANGLLTKVIIYVDENGQRSLLDGRNRLDGWNSSACQSSRTA